MFLVKIGFISQYTLILARYNEFNNLSTFLCLPNNTICQTLQNTILFPIQILRSTHNAYYTDFSWGLGTDNNCWGPGLENTVDVEVIWYPNRAFMPVQCSMCEIVHRHHEEGFFSSSKVVVSSWFLKPIDSKIQHSMLQ